MNRGCPWAAVVVLVLALGAGQARAVDVIHVERSLYRDIEVIETDGRRCIRFSRADGVQSCMFPRFPDEMALDYAKMMMGAFYLIPDPRALLFIGLGGGTLPTAVAKLFPDAAIDVVEIDPAMTRVAREYFGFRTGPRLHVAEEDGRVFVRRAVKAGRHYDVVLIDAFRGDTIPEHLLTREFLAEIKQLLKPRGAITINTIPNRLYDNVSATYTAVFGRFFNLRKGNRIVIASVTPLPDMTTLHATAARFDDRFTRYGVDSGFLLPLFSTAMDWNPAAQVLTDQYVPANLLNEKPLQGMTGAD